MESSTQHPLKETVVAELKAAIDQYGPDAGPKMVRKNYPNIAKATWYRWLSELKATPIDNAVREARRLAKATVADHLPAVPAPAYLCDRPVEARNAIDVMGKVQQLETFALMLMAYSTKESVDKNGNPEIKNPMYFVQAAKLYDNALARLLEACGLLYEWQRMQNFYDAIVEEIRVADPEIARRIMDRLAALDRDRGFTFNARPV